MNRLMIPAALILSFLMLAAPVAAVTYTLTVKTDNQAYVGTSTIHLSGQVSPAPGPNTAVFIRVFNQNRIMVTADEAPVNGTTGLYSDAIVAGGSSAWISGNFVVNASWGAYGQVVYATTGFMWAPSSGSTTTTSTSTTTSSSSSTSSTISTTSSATSQTSSTTSSATSPTSSTTPLTASSSSTGGGGGGIPEFPYQLLTVGVFTVLIAASYLLIARGRGHRSLGRTRSGAP